MNNKLKLWKIKTYIVAKEFFQYSLLSYLIILIAETIKEGIVSYFFNINIILAVVLLSGFVMAITFDEKLTLPSPTHKKITYRDIIFSVLLALGGGFFVYAGTFDMGIVAVVSGCLAMFLVLLLSLLILTE